MYGTYTLEENQSIYKIIIHSLTDSYMKSFNLLLGIV